MPVFAAFLGLGFTGALTNLYVRYKVDIKTQVEAVKAQLPPGANLEALGYVHPAFAYYLARPMTARPCPENPSDITPDGKYFRFSADQHPNPRLPFAWQNIATVGCDQGSLTPSTRSVIIGRRLKGKKPIHRAAASSRKKSITAVRATVRASSWLKCSRPTFCCRGRNRESRNSWNSCRAISAVAASGGTPNVAECARLSESAARIAVSERVTQDQIQ